MPDSMQTETFSVDISNYQCWNQMTRQYSGELQTDGPATAKAWQQNVLSRQPKFASNMAIQPVFVCILLQMMLLLETLISLVWK